MVKKYKIVDGRLIEGVENGAPIVIYVDPSDEERKALVDNFLIDEHTLASALDPDELSRIEFEPNHVAVIYKKPKSFTAQDTIFFKIASIGLFIFKDRLIIVSKDEFPLFEGKQFNRVHSNNDILLKLVYRSIFHFLEHLRAITMVTDQFQQKINTSLENKYLIDLFNLQKSLVYYLNAINSNAVLIEKLKLNTVKLGFSTEEAEFLDDIIIENTQCYRQAEIHSNILASLMDARASIVSNNLNVLMKTLNIITIGIMVPTFVVSAFSMNVRIPLQTHYQAFWIIMGLAAISCGLFYLFWKKKKW